jgi:hypothetical protein
VELYQDQRIRDECAQAYLPYKASFGVLIVSKYPSLGYQLREVNNYGGCALLLVRLTQGRSAAQILDRNTAGLCPTGALHSPVENSDNILSK